MILEAAFHHDTYYSYKQTEHTLKALQNMATAREVKGL